MSHLDDNDDKLARELRNRSQEVGGHPIEFDSVRRTARGIQRRRRIAGGVAAAAVLAVAVPAGMAASGSLNLGQGQEPAGQPTTTVSVTTPAGEASESTATTEPTPSKSQPTQTSSPPTSPATKPTDSASPSPSADPNAGKKVDLTAVGAVRGADPGITYIDGQTLHMPDAPPVNLGASYYDIAPHRGGWVALGSDDDGRLTLFFLDADGTVQDSAATTGESLAINHDGDYVAYALTNGVIELAPTEDAGETWTFRRLEASAPITPVAVGSVIKKKYEEPICTIFYNIEGPQPQARYASCHGIVEKLRAITSLSGIARDGSQAGVVSVFEGSTCSQVRDADWSLRWETCDYAVGRFSADSRYVLARSPYGDEGGGDIQVTVLDAQTGDVMVSYQTARNSESFVADVAWEDDSHVLATVQEDGVWRILRLDLDGNIEAATGEMQNHEAPRFSATP